MIIYKRGVKDSTEMRMTITNIEYENSRVYVIGDTSIGNLKGEWCDKAAPVLGKTYFFELNIGDLDKEEIMAFFR